MSVDDAMKNTQSNVVSLAQYDASGNKFAPAEMLALLNECRDRLCASIERVWNERREAMEMTLLSTGDNSPILENRNWYFQAQSVLRQRNETLMSALRRHISRRVDGLTGVKSNVNQFLSDAPVDLEHLSLVDDEVFETTLAVSKVASRLQMDAVEAITALDQRVGHLAQSLRGQYAGNPFAPNELCEAFLEACAELDDNLKVRLILLQQFDVNVVPLMPTLYQELNRFLVDKQVLPSIKVGLGNTPSKGLRSSGVSGSAQAGLVGNGQAMNQDPSTGESGGASEVDVFALLQQLLGRQLLASGQATNFVGGGHWTEPRAEAGTERGGNPILSLTQLQRGQFSAPANFDMARMQSGRVNVVRDIRDAGLIQTDNRTDNFVIDIVAMLFDYIFDDEQIAPALKALIGRLQIPVLKVAMLDRQFFSKKNHPARRLLDDIVSGAIGWNEEGEWNAALFTKLSGVVQSILNDFTDEVSIFDTLQADFHTFLLTRESETLVIVAKTAQAIETIERSQFAESKAQTTLQQVLHDANVVTEDVSVLPGIIMDFVRQTWTKVLVHTFTHGGEHSPAWQADVKTMRDLLWSVTPKLNTEDRLALVAMLPELLRNLRDGMHRIEVKADQQEVIFSALVSCHSAAVKAGLQQTHIAPPVDTEAYSSVLNEVAAQPMPGLGEIEEVTEHFDFLPEPVESFNEDAFTEQARCLKKGMWIEFIAPDGGRRAARLSWVSSLRGVYLFTDNRGLNAITITLSRLAARLRAGEAKVMKSGSFTERAVDGLISRLRV